MKTIFPTLLLLLLITTFSCGKLEYLFGKVEYLGSIKIPKEFSEFIPYKNYQEVVFWDSLKMDLLRFRVSRTQYKTKIEYEVIVHYVLTIVTIQRRI